MQKSSSVEIGDLSFVSTGGGTSHDIYSGNMEHSELPKSTADYGPDREGVATNMLKSRGFGWLMEIEEIDDEAFDKPLL